MAAEEKSRRPGPKKPGRRPPAGRPDRKRGRQTDSRPRRTPSEAGRPAEKLRRERPEIPDDVTASQLSGQVRRQLRGLPDRIAEMVGQHLAMAGRLIDDDPAGAYEHALAARSLAARVGVVREACGETAYAAGRYSDALAELRAARRMTGAPDYLPMMADCERALGRPERALRLAQEPAAAKLDAAGRAELTIVVSGARRDMGQGAAALQVLEAASLGSQEREPWVARLRYAYADALLEAGRVDDAIEWFHRTVAVDDQSATDAPERLAELEGRQPG
jgi:tetratricopeptide (TPR) repeat protein